MAVLRASNLAKSYKQKKVVIDVSLEIRSGEIVGLLGPNGAGKTTCFYMIVGLVPADRGRITIDSRDITPLPMHGRARQGIGFAFPLARRLTVYSGRTRGFDPAQAVLGPVQDDPLGSQAGIALLKFHSAGVGGNALAVIQAGGICGDLDRSVRIKVKCSRRADHHDR